MKMNTEPGPLALKERQGVQGDFLQLVTTGEAEMPQGLAIGWCCEVSLRLRLGLRLGQMMAEDCTTQVTYYHL